MLIWLSLTREDKKFMDGAYSLIERSPFFAFSEEVRQICHPIFEQFGINFFDYARYYHNNTCEYFFTNKHYIEFFFNHPAYQLTPVTVPPGKYLWSGYINNELLEEINTKFNHYHGMTYIRAQKDYLECFNFAAPKSNTTILNVFLNQENILEYFVTFFIQTVESFRKRHKDNRIIVPNSLLEQEKQQILLDNKEAAQHFIEACNKRLNLRKNTYLFPLNNTLLTFTLRELQCLSLLSSGFSTKQISKKLNRSIRTIDVFRSNVLQKTGSYSTVELLGKLDQKTRNLLTQLVPVS